MKRVRIQPGVIGFRGNRHWRGREVLDLFEVEIKTFGYSRKFSHIFFSATRVRGDEIRNNLLVELFVLIYIVENLLEFSELRERWLTHQLKNTVGSVLGSHFKSSRHVVCNKFFIVATIDAINSLIAVEMHR